MVICEKCKGKNKLAPGYTELSTGKIPGLNRVKCTGCGALIRGRFWIKSKQIKRVKVPAAV